MNDQVYHKLDTIIGAKNNASTRLKYKKINAISCCQKETFRRKCGDERKAPET